MVIVVNSFEIRHHNIDVFSKCGNKTVLSFFDMKYFTTEGNMVKFEFLLNTTIELQFDNVKESREFIEQFLFLKYSLYAQLFLHQKDYSRDTDCAICLDCDDSSPLISMKCCGCVMHRKCFALLCTSCHYTKQRFKIRVAPRCPYCRKLYSPFLQG